MDFSSVSVERPYQQIVRQIQAAIRDGHLAVGSRLPTERELAEQFGVSRSVVREAIKVLGTMGLVESRQGSGSFVRNSTIETISRAFVLSVSPDAESVEKLFEFRQILEVQSARLAAIRRTAVQAERITTAAAAMMSPNQPDHWRSFGEVDDEFHQAIAEASNNPYLDVAVASAREMLQDVASLFVGLVGSIEVALDHHRQLADAIARQDPDAAAAMMREHISYTAHTIQNQLTFTGTSVPQQEDTPRT